MINLNENEEKILQYWKEHDIMGKVRARNAGRRPFYFLDGPPFVSGDLHPGQMWVKSMKDVFLRYRRFRGYDVYDRAGYDVHGLPIEKRAEAQLGIRSKKEIETVVGVEKFVQTCRDYVQAYIGRMDNDYRRFAISLDFSNPYIPSTRRYMEAEWANFKSIHEKGLLYRDKRATTFCTSCGTSLAQGSMEVEYKNDSDPSVLVAFKVNAKTSKPSIKIGEELYLMIWTTTPWTLPANISVAANPREQYIIASIAGRRYVMMKGRLDSISSLLGESAVVEAEFYGSELDGIRYISPLEETVPMQKELRKYHRIIMEEGLVSSEEGSGLVHIAPGHGLEDYLAGKRNKLPIFSPVDMQGVYTAQAGEYAGLKVPEEANARILDSLKESGALVNKGSITHSYPHCWRCDTKLIFIATEQWFVNIQKVKKRIIRENAKVSWHPAEAMKWQESVLQSSPDWTLSRQRYWGVPMPVWECRCGEIAVMGSVEELRRRTTDITYVDSMQDLHRPYIDGVVLRCEKCGGGMHRVKDVLDVWFDSSSAYRASLTQEQFDRLFPVDYILEGMDQLRGWFQGQLKLGTIVHGRRPFDNVVIDGMMLGEDGREMHKKLGNYIPLPELLNISSADSFRLWCISHTPQLDLVISREKIAEAGRAIVLLYNVSNLMDEYSDAIGYRPRKVGRPRKVSGLSAQDAWIVSRLNSTIMSVTDALEGYQADKAAALLRSFLTVDLSRFYLKLAKKRILYGDRKEAKAVLDVISYLLYNVLVAMAPIIPFSTERIYLDRFGRRESIFLEDWPRADRLLINKGIEDDFDMALGAVTAILSARETAGVKLRWPISRATVVLHSDRAFDAVQRLAPIIEEYANVKKLEVERAEASGVEVRPRFARIGPDFKENAGAVAAALRLADAKEMADTIARAGIYVLHTQKGAFEVTQEHFDTLKKAAGADVAVFEYGTAAIDKEINRGLWEEAMLREFERGVQLARKEMGLKKSDKIRLHYSVSEELAGMLEKSLKRLKSDIGAQSIVRTEHVAATLVKEFEVEDEKILVGIDKL